MANQEYSSHIKRVLKSYQSSAVKSLHGPSPYMTSDNDERSKKTDLNESSSNSIKILGYKKFLQQQALRSAHQQSCVSSEMSKQTDDCSQKSCVTHSSNRSSCCPTSKTNVEDADLKCQLRLKSRRNLAGDVSKCHVFDLDSSTTATSTDGGGKVRCYEDDDLEKCPVIVTDGKSSSYPCSYRNEEEKWLDKRAIASAALLQFHQQKETQELQPYHDAITTQTSRSTPNSYGGWADVGAFTPPSPHSPTAYVSPPHAPFPFVMGHADVCGGKGEALLEGQKVSCFIVGGERRLCFPQVLYTSLKDFSMAQINAEIESLHIYLSLCSSRQLQVLKEACALPSTANSCGLITYSDAHRLTHALVHANAPQIDPPKTVTLPYNSSTHQFISNTKTSQLTSVNNHSTNQLTPNIIVSHRCFGKCRGWVYLSLYDHPDAKCIQCCECRSFFSPEQFVCHAHRSLETRTCHWGFDPANWRMYLQLASDQPRQPPGLGNSIVVIPETFLEQFKTKFPLTGISATRQRQGHETDLCQHDRGMPAGDSSPYYAHQQEALDIRNRADLRSLCGNSDDGRECIAIINERRTPPQHSGVGGDDAGEMENNGRLATLSVPSKSGKGFAPPPAALVRESLPAPLPPNLRSKGPPMLADPAQVVPLSQYDKFRHYQPNITLAPPKRRGSDSQRELYPSETSLEEISRKGQNAIDVLDSKEKVVKEGCRERHSGEQEQEVSAKASCDLSDKQNLRAIHTRSEEKSYSISLCPSYRAVDERNFRTLSHLPKDYAGNGTPVIVSTDRDSNDRKQYFTPQDLGLLSMSGASVPKDLQIIKLDASFVGDGRCGRDSRGVVDSTPTDLKIFKLVPPADASSEPHEEKYSQSQEFAERRKSECVVPISERVVVKEEIVSDHESRSTCSYWRKHIPQPVTVSEMQQFSGLVSNRAEDYDVSHPTDLRRCARISEACVKPRDRSCSSNGICRHRSRSFSPRLVKTETTCRCTSPDATRIVAEITSLLERWSDKNSVSRVLDLVHCLTAGLGVPTDNRNTDSSLHSPGTLGVQVSSCNKSRCSHSVSPRKQLTESSGDSILYAAVSYANTNGMGCNEKKKAAVLTEMPKRSNKFELNSGDVPGVIKEESESRDTRTRVFDIVSVSKSPEVQKLSTAGAIQNFSQERERGAMSDDSTTISAESSDDGNASSSIESKVDQVSVKPAVGDIRHNSVANKNNEDEDQQVMNDHEVLKSGSFKRGEGNKNESVVVNTACKRQLLEDRGQTPSPELKARISSLEEELTHLKAEFQGCKKLKTEPADVTKSASSDRHSSLHVNTCGEHLPPKQEEKVSCALGSRCESTQDKHHCQAITGRSITRERSKSREIKDRRTSASLTKSSRRNTLDGDEKMISNSSEGQNMSEVVEKSKALKRVEYCPPGDRTKLKGVEARVEGRNFSTAFSDRESDIVNLKDAGYSRDFNRVRVSDEREKNRRKVELKNKSSKT